jgi:hypothetical protein
MSANPGLAEQVANSPVKTQIQINFAAPGALNTDVVGTDSDTGINQFNLVQPNIIADIQHTVDPAAGLVYTLFVRRLNFQRTALGRTPNFLTTFTGERRSGMPKALRAGFMQFAEQQNAGALTAQNYIITTIRPLVEKSV